MEFSVYYLYYDERSYAAIIQVKGNGANSNPFIVASSTVDVFVVIINMIATLRFFMAERTALLMLRFILAASHCSCVIFLE